MLRRKTRHTLQIILFLLIGLTLIPCWAEKYDPALEWKTYETEHFVFHYDKKLRHLTERLAPKSEQVHKTLGEYFDWQPSEKTHVVLTDKIDGTNGTATVMFSNAIVLYTSPPYEPFGLEDFDNWLELVFIHEYTHILHLDMSSGLPKHLRWIFGRLPVLFPNAFMPRWLVEGIATYIETDEKTDSGRGNSTYFRALMRMEIENGFLSAGNVSQVMESWPGLTRWYLYGVYWFKFLEEKYGQEKIIELLKHQGSFPVPYLPDVGSWLALDKTLVSLWPEFEFYVQKQFNQEIATLKENQWQAGENISDSGFGNRNPVFIDDQNILYVANDGIDSSWLTQYDIAKESHTRIRRVYGHRFDYHPKRGVLIAQSEIYRNVNLYTDLYIVDIKTGEQKKLTRAARYLFANWSSDGNKIIAVKQVNAEHKLHILDVDGELLQEIPLTKDSIINSLDWSPDDSHILASLWKPGHRWHLEEFDLNSNTWQALSNNTSFEVYAKYLDNENILYSADYGPSYNTYTLNKTTKQVTQLNSVTGASYSADLRGNTLVYSGLNGKGFDIYLTKETQVKDIDPVLKAIDTDLPASAPPVANDVEENESKYIALKYVNPRWWFPSYFHSSTEHFIGVNTAAFDYLSWHNYALNLNYDIINERPFGSISYFSNRWWPGIGVTGQRRYGVTAMLNSLDFSIHLPWQKRDKNWLSYAGVSYIDSEYLLFNGTTEQLSIEDAPYKIYGAGLNLSTLKKNAYTVTPHSGVLADIKLERLDERPVYTPAYNASIYASAFSPLFLRTSLNLRAIMGISGNTAHPYYLFGSSEYRAGGSITDFGQRTYSLRGYSVNDRTNREGNIMQYFGAEWNFPIARVENGFVFPPIGLVRIQGSMFAEMGRAWYDHTDVQQNFFTDAGRHLLSGNNNNAPGFSRSVGAEITFRTSILFTAACEYAIGVSRGLDEGGEVQPYMFIGCN